MANELKTQWHPAFCSAMRLELKEDSEYLDYTNEYNLNSKPLEIDLLIIKKIKSIEIRNNIGKIFRKHNIIEYKSPDDSMNVNTYLKVIAYACLYKADEEHVDMIALEDITITLVRDRKPIKLLKWLRRQGYQIIEKYRGIYYAVREHSFPTQILVSKDLSKEEQKWLTMLSNRLTKEDARRIISQMDGLVKEDEKRHGDSVLQVVLKENRSIFETIKQEGDIMCEELRKLMEPEIIAEAEERAKVMAEERAKVMAEERVKVLVEEQSRHTKRNLILNALKIGSSIEDIARILGLPLQEIQAISCEAVS